MLCNQSLPSSTSLMLSSVTGFCVSRVGPVWGSYSKASTQVGVLCSNKYTRGTPIAFLGVGCAHRCHLKPLEPELGDFSGRLVMRELHCCYSAAFQEHRAAWKRRQQTRAQTTAYLVLGLL